MKSLEVFIRAMEILLYTSMPLFIASTVYLIAVVRKSSYDLMRNAVKNPILPAIDLSFFKKLRVTYESVGKNRFPSAVNGITFWTTVGGFVVLLILVITKELITY